MRVVILILVVAPLVHEDMKPILFGLLFVPAIACSVGVAHSVSDREDEDDIDFVGPVFRRAGKEGLWVLAVLVLGYPLAHLSGRSGC